MKRILLALAAVGALTAVTVDIASAERRGRRVEGTVTGPRGGETGIVREVRRGAGARDAATTITGPGGETGTATRSRVYDPATGTGSATTVFEGPAGRTRSVESDVTKTGEGEYALGRTITKADGSVVEQTGSVSVDRTDTGYNASGSLTGPAGTTTFSRSASREDGVRTVTGTATGPDGGTRTIDRTADASTGTISETRTATGPGGATRSVDTTLVKDGSTVTGERVVTSPTGETRTSTGAFTVTPIEE